MTASTPISNALPVVLNTRLTRRVIFRDGASVIHVQTVACLEALDTPQRQLSDMDGGFQLRDEAVRDRIRNAEDFLDPSACPKTALTPPRSALTKCDLTIESWRKGMYLDIAMILIDTFQLDQKPFRFFICLRPRTQEYRCHTSRPLGSGDSSGYCRLDDTKSDKC
ncbi:hypothetical protein MRB53_041640 [Persea americana]|nr:hypothetical protein MRB53_041640 [Persea americana]